MRLPGSRRARLAARWLGSRARPRAIILGYHRVTVDPEDPFSLCVTPGHLAEHLEVLRRRARPIPLGELVRALAHGEVPERAVAVTFDDGYEDLLTEARPLLERHDVPATAFLIAGLLGREFWWDALRRIIETPSRLPERLGVTGDGGWLVGPLPGIAKSTGTAEGRGELVRELHRRLLPLDPETRVSRLEAIAEWAGVPVQAPANGQALDPAQVVELARGGLVEIGCHTLTHPVLPVLAVERQREEIERGKIDLESLVGGPVTSFSYPHGRWDRQTARLVRASGFECACTSRNDVVLRGSDRLALPRFWIPDCDGERFSRWLGRWLGSFRGRV